MRSPTHRAGAEAAIHLREGPQGAQGELELDRLLYVACTRARSSLHLVGSVGVAADGQSYKAPTAGTLLRRLWPALQQDFENAFAASGIAESAGDYEEEGAEPHLVQPRLRRLAVEPPSQAPQLPPSANVPSQAVSAKELRVTFAKQPFHHFKIAGYEGAVRYGHRDFPALSTITHECGDLEDDLCRGSRANEGLGGCLQFLQNGIQCIGVEFG